MRPARAAAADPEERDTDDTEAQIQHRRELVARAEQALARRWPFDERRPFQDLPYDETELASLYLDACRAGDRPSCWIGSYLERWDLGRPAAHRVIENCRTGDLPSCRAIRAGDGVPDAMGAAGRSVACEEASDPRCNETLLRRECEAGFPLSCLRIAERAGTGSPDGKALMARRYSLLPDGCRARILDECAAISILHGNMFGPELSCPLELFACSELSVEYRARGWRVRARDLLERECQYERSPSVCIELGEAYIERTLPEPVPGRGEALITWGCSHSESSTAPVCQARHNTR